jgi:hypothetical protein
MFAHANTATTAVPLEGEQEAEKRSLHLRGKLHARKENASPSVKRIAAKPQQGIGPPQNRAFVKREKFY